MSLWDYTIKKDQEGPGVDLLSNIDPVERKSPEVARKEIEEDAIIRNESEEGNEVRKGGNEEGIEAIVEEEE